jgi:hypothetical protein
MMVQTTAGVHTIDRRYLRAAANFGVSRWVLFGRVVIPAVLPEIIVGMRIGVAWLVVVAAEMIALRSGLGYLIMDSRNAGNRYDLVIASMIQPIQRPSGTAIRNASPNPMPTRKSDAPMCCHKVPSRARSHAPVTTCHGVGKIALSFFTTRIHQIAIRSMITTVGGTIFVSVALLALTGPPPFVPSAGHARCHAV